MFITRFSTISDEIQDYYYNNVEDADKYLKLFLNDDSGLYRNICVFDDTRRIVLEILPFLCGKPQKLIVDGSIVKINPSWCSPGEEKYIFRISNIHEDTERACILCLNSIMTIQPSELVNLNMIFPM